MGKKSIAIAILLLPPFGAEAQVAGELLWTLDPSQAQRLEEYNSVFLQETLYSEARHRIVGVNADLLLHDEAITITPFEDVEPIVISPERVNRSDYRASWLGRILVDPASVLFDVKSYTFMSVSWWDVDNAGNAEISSLNRLQFSPAWTIDENNRPVLRNPAQTVPNEIGPPPQTAEEISEHKRISELKRFAFGSLSAKLQLPSGKTYYIQPLRFTPKYAVVYENDPDKIVPVIFEPGDEKRLSPEQKARVDQYNSFLRSLPVETDKAIREEVE